MPLLDRLIDDEPDTQHDPPLSAAESARAVAPQRAARSSKRCCNARRRWRSWPSGLQPSSAHSPVGYGITDFAAGAFNDPAQRDRLRLEIEHTIRRFEPRLAQVSASSCSTAATRSKRRCGCASRGCCAPSRRPSRSRSTRWSTPRPPKCRSSRTRATGRRSRCLTRCSPITTANSTLSGGSPPNLPNPPEDRRPAAASPGDRRRPACRAPLLEGVAFLAARVHHRLDDEFPELTDALLGRALSALPGARSRRCDRPVPAPARADDAGPAAGRDRRSKPSRCTASHAGSAPPGR